MKFFKKFASVLAGAWLAASTAIVPAAALSEQTISVDEGVKIYVNNEELIPLDGYDQRIPAFIYANTTYIPAKAISTYFGKTTTWDPETSSVFIQDVVPYEVSYKPEGSVETSALQSRTYSVSTGVNVYYNGVLMDTRDAAGNPVPSLIYNSTTYVPARAVSTYLGKEVSWNGATATVYINDPVQQTPVVVQPAPEPAPTPSVPVTTSYMLNLNTGKFHRMTCGDIKKMAERNKMVVDWDRSTIIAYGYSPCGHCKP